TDGIPLRFKDGKFYEGFDKVEVQDGTVMRFAPTSVQDGFVLWRDGRPIDWRMREWLNTSQPISRGILGDNDESKWPEGKDPWVFTMLAALKDAEGVLYKFSTSSSGGSNAIRKLMREWRRLREKHPGLVPLVTLGSDFYVHKVHKNQVRIPTFEIVGWEPW